MKDKLILTIISFRIASVIYIGLAFLFPYLIKLDSGDAPPELINIITILCVAICIAIPILSEVVIWYLKKNKFWAWIVALCISAMYLMSAYFPMGAFALWGLLDTESRRRFGVGVPKSNE